MKVLYLHRLPKHEDGVFGVLSYESRPFAVTLEPEDKNNQRNISCIPSGRYLCKRVESPKFGNTFQVTGVYNRSGILFHAGNTEEDSKGCILVGEEFGELYRKTAILKSRKGLAEFLKLLNGDDEFWLSIVWACK